MRPWRERWRRWGLTRRREVAKTLEGRVFLHQTRRGAGLKSVRKVRQAIDAFNKAYNQNAAPFEWTKVTVKAKSPSKLVRASERALTVLVDP